MRWLTVALLSVAILWGGYWFVGSRALDRGVTAWLNDLPAQGFPVSYADVAVRGFPNRFDLAIEQPVLGDPAFLQWRAPFFHLLALSYRPYSLIAVWPQSQQLFTAYQTFTLTSERARASVLFRPTLALPLDHLELVVDGGALASQATDGAGTNWQATFAQFRFATRQLTAPQQTDAENTHRIGLELVGLAPDAALRAAIDPDNALPEQVDAIHLDLTLRLDRALDRNALAKTPPGLLALTLSSLALEWGGMSIQAEGALTRSPDGTPEGKITVRLKDWRRMVALAQALALIGPVDAGNIARALSALEGMSLDKTQLPVPLTFAGGRISVAGLPLFASPRF